MDRYRVKIEKISEESGEVTSSHSAVSYGNVDEIELGISMPLAECLAATTVWGSPDLWRIVALLIGELNHETKSDLGPALAKVVREWNDWGYKAGPEFAQYVNANKPAPE